MPAAGTGAVAVTATKEQFRLLPAELDLAVQLRFYFFRSQVFLLRMAKKLARPAEAAPDRKAKSIAEIG